MKNKWILLLVPVLVFSACASPDYVPLAGGIATNTYGAYISIVTTDNGMLQGELIAVDNTRIWVLTDNDGRCKEVADSTVKRLNVQYAKAPNYAWTIPVFTLGSLIHGYFAILTFPVNLIASIAISSSANKSYRYEARKVEPQVLSKYARFPQGLPPHVSLTEITR